MNVIAKISCYFQCSVVTLKLRKEYLSSVTYNKAILLWIKTEQFDIIERYSVSTYTEVTNFQKQKSPGWPTMYTVFHNEDIAR